MDTKTLSDRPTTTASRRCKSPRTRTRRSTTTSRRKSRQENETPSDGRFQRWNGQMGAGTHSLFHASRPRLTHPLSSFQLRKHRPNPTYVPCMRPAPPYIVDVRIISNRYNRVHAERMIILTSFSLPLPTQVTHRHRCVPSSYTPRPTKFAVQSTS